MLLLALRCPLESGFESDSRLWLGLGADGHVGGVTAAQVAVAGTFPQLLLAPPREKGPKWPKLLVLLPVTAGPLLSLSQACAVHVLTIAAPFLPADK